MSEQWFLDLDGVRSGPYQTSEVMSLVAEGEILPHHQIATDLKSQKWMTILEWRLNQNRTAEPKKESPAPNNSAFSPVQEKPVPPIEPVEIVKPSAPIQKAAPPTTPPPVVATPPKINPSPSASKPSGKRDPMAEMFDMLQNTKQKREVKSQQSHAQAHAHSTAAPDLSPNVVKTSGKGNWGKTIAIGTAITIVGFALGQYFQHKKAKELPSTAATSATPTASPSPETQTAAALPEKEQIVDRSTDKMTIRAQVPANSHSAATPTSTPEHSKDIQELKELKKELLELKALKDEIRNNNDPPDNLENTPDGAKNINHYDIEPDPNNPPTDENGLPSDPAGSDVHY